MKQWRGIRPGTMGTFALSHPDVVCGGEEFQSKYIAFEDNEYINVNLQWEWLSDNSTLKRSTTRYW